MKKGAQQQQRVAGVAKGAQRQQQVAGVAKGAQQQQQQQVVGMAKGGPAVSLDFKFTPSQQKAVPPRPPRGRRRTACAWERRRAGSQSRGARCPLAAFQVRLSKCV
jgi:hypothetical protein